MINHGVKSTRTLLAIAISAVFSTAAFAQAPEGPLQEIVVTAQRIAAPESRTPVSLSVLTGEQLAAMGVSAPGDIGARLPNVRIDNSYDGLRISMRGVSNADTTEKGDPSAALMMDGIYIARPQAQNLGFYDIARIEVLRGPQGTLYGRNTTAGAVNIITNTPTQQLEGAVSVGLGDYASRQGSAMLNVPLSPALALRAALNYDTHDSYLINGQGTPWRLGQDRDEKSARLSARWTVNDAVSLLLRYDHSTARDDNDSFVPDTNFYHSVATGAPSWYDASTDQRLTNGFVPPNGRPDQGYSHKTNSGLGAELNWNLGPVTLSYLGSHRSFDHDYLLNYYYRVAPTFALGVRQSFRGAYTQNSHELRVATNGSGPLTAQAGLYYFRESSDQLYVFRDLQLLGLPPYYVFPHGPTVSTSKALFGQATYSLTPSLRATAGARYTDDSKSRVGSTNFQQGLDFNPATDFKLLNAAELSTHQTTWRLGLDYDLAPSTLLYGAIATGYKSGGFNDGCLAGTRALGIDCPAPLAVSASALYYQPETLRSYEAGLKTRFWHHKASLNLSAFKYDYKNLQLSSVAVVQGAPRYVTSNAGVASVKGLEAEGAAQLTSADQITYALALLDAHYVSYTPDGLHSWAGRKLDNAPANTLTLGYEHAFRLDAGTLKAGVSSRKSSCYSIGVPTQQLQYPIPARTISDASLSYHPAHGAWNVLARVKNIENKVQPLSIDSFGMVVPSAPRTVDLRLDYRF